MDEKIELNPIIEKEKYDEYKSSLVEEDLEKEN